VALQVQNPLDRKAGSAACFAAVNLSLADVVRQLGCAGCASALVSTLSDASFDTLTVKMATADVVFPGNVHESTCAKVQRGVFL
jgi:hypothetical protein